MDARGVFCAATSGVTDLLGYPTAELIGRPAVALLHHEDVGRWNDALAGGVARGTPPAPTSCRWRHQAGHWLPLVVANLGAFDTGAGTGRLLALHGPGPELPQGPHVGRLRLAIEQSPAAVIMTDAQGRIEYVNRRFTEMTGYLPEEVLGQTPRLLKSGFTPEHVYQDLWRTILAGEVWRGELRNRRKDGSDYWHSASISPVRDAAGAISGFVAVQEDATERRRVLEALAAKEAEYRRIVDTATEGIWQVDAEHRTTFVNQRLAAMLGYEVTEMIGRPVFDFTDDEGRAIAEASLARRRQGIREQLDFKLRRRDGSTFWVLLSTGPILDDAGRYAGALAMVTDVTARREAEQALRRGETWFRALIEGVQSLVAVVRPDGTVRYASPSYERLLGFPPAELEGRSAFDFVHPDDIAVVARVFGEGMQYPGAVRMLQFRHRCRDGGWRTLEGVGRNLVEDPIVGGAIINSYDVTERLEMEAHLRQAQKMEAVGGLVGGVAHDFNNILGVILAASTLVLDDLPSEHPNREDVLDIHSAAEKAAALTRQLLAFSRQQVLVPRVLDLNELIRNLMGMLGRVLREDITLSSRLAEGPMLVRADPGQLEQVLLNLAVNARDAMPDGGTLVISTAAVEIGEAQRARHPQLRPGPHVELIVRDSGIGMSKETQARAFDPFFTTKPTGQGTGLGLATVYGIVKQSDGFIWIDSAPGEGTALTIHLPRVQAAPVSADTGPESLPGWRGTEVVLLAEDNAEMRTTLRRALERHGYTVLDGSGDRAIEVAGAWQGRIHLLLTDVVMPGISGPELARTLRAARPGLRVVYMSGHTDTEQRVRVVQAGDPYLQKPFAVPELLWTVRRALDGTAPGTG